MNKNIRLTHPPRARSGNAIVLVIGLLVLLVIIATAFVTRTHAGRVTASSLSDALQRDDRVEVISRSIAWEIASSLFVRPISDADPAVADPGGRLADPNIPRGPIPAGSVRGGVDPRVDPGLDGLFGTADDVPYFPYNVAAWAVRAWTNWPDAPLGMSDPGWPAGAGNPGGGTAFLSLAGAGNPVGGPGYGDNRFLASHEPTRHDTNLDGVLDAFGFWPHLTNLARAGNGLRVCRNISDITNVTGLGGVVTDLRIPFEQWMLGPRNLDAVTGDAVYDYDPASGDGFVEHFAHWFSGDYQAMYANDTGFSFDYRSWAPGNFWNLSNLDGGLDSNGDGDRIDPGERPEDAFAGPSAAWPTGSPRWNVARVLADADGDGFTDSFWVLLPGTLDGGIRQIAAVRIIDNAAMLNANVALRSRRSNPTPGLLEATTGATPADLALVGDLDDPAYATDLRVGYFDNPAHWEISFPYPVGGPPDDPASPYGTTVVAWSPLRWAAAGDSKHAFLVQLGIDGHPAFPTLLRSSLERSNAWNLIGRRPFDPRFGFTPFNLADEIELRMFHGNNHAWTLSRFERAVNTTGSEFALLRSTNNQFAGRRESAELLDQLSNRELLFDSRRNLTLFSATRNDIMPRWLWPSAQPRDLNLDGVIDAAEHRLFEGSIRKFDLRQPILDTADLADRVLRALHDGDESGGTGYFGAYDGVGSDTFERLRRAAAGLAANATQYRDADAGLRLTEAVRLPGLGTFPVDHDIRMLGLEPQPFLVETLIGHLYRSTFTVGPGYTNTASNLVHDTSPQTTVIIVQIANPFDEPLDLTGFGVRVFGNDANGLVAFGGTLASNETRTFYSIDAAVTGTTAVIDSFGLDTLGARAAVTLPTSRMAYDTADEEEAIEIVRLVSRDDGLLEEVVLDRIDIFGDLPPSIGGVGIGFGRAVTQLTLPPVDVDPGAGAGLTYPGIDLGTETQFFQWARALRQWEDDLDGNGAIEPRERNPRYVFADRLVEIGEDTFTFDIAGLPVGLEINCDFDTRRKNWPDAPPRPYSMQMLHKPATTPAQLGGFVQLGELYDLWMFAHELEFDGPSVDDYVATRTTFSEFMSSEALCGDDLLVNRLRAKPMTTATDELGSVIGVGDPMQLRDPRHAMPALPAAVRLADAFVIDGTRAGSRSRLAMGFTGKGTPGMININPAPPEVMRSLPHASRLVHENDPPSLNPFVRLPESIVQYRERHNGAVSGVNATGYPNGPDYSDRGAAGGHVKGMRSERGIESIGELLLIDRAASASGLLEPADGWRIDFAARDPFGNGGSTDLGTDIIDGVDPVTGFTVADEVAGDAEEHNLLFAGLSNLVTTRSDTFTVYFLVRSVRQDPLSGRWDATDLDHIVDESRFVMLIDRSEVDRPTDRPRILYLERLPR